MMAKNTEKNLEILLILGKILPFQGLLIGKKGPKNSGKGKPPPHFRAMPELKRLFSLDGFPN